MVKLNDYEIQEDYVIMYTAKGELFFIDLEDFWKVKDVCWHIDEKGYVKGKLNGKNTRMHRLIMNCPKGYNVDHKHGRESRNDNRKDNLRIVTVSQNTMNVGIKVNNTSGVTGVSFDKTMNRWKAQIGINNKMIHLGRFDNFDDAVQARQKAEEIYFGEYSYNNSQEPLRK